MQEALARKDLDYTENITEASIDRLGVSKKQLSSRALSNLYLRVFTYNIGRRAEGSVASGSGIRQAGDRTLEGRAEACRRAFRKGWPD